jgi:hypothetical protein
MIKRIKNMMKVKIKKKMKTWKKIKYIQILILIQKKFGK